ncbi:MAG: type III-A CRISPR-associated RAMP protein Csm5, partial [candidate division WOR-3 bacterium]|nr:type III-A CRISPR-associated RAMP protein Csm5 [candidate division WOR-3 bacterium]
MKIKIQILSPVHIGTGEKKNRMAFIIKNQNISFINEDLFNFLVNKTGLTDKFIKWAQEGGNDISQFLKDHSEIKKEVLNNPLYSLPIRGTIEKEVALHIKDPSNQFFIPGSSIKGAIRTALLYTVLEETKPNIDYLLKGISNTDIKGVLNLEKRYAKWAGMEIEKFVFRAGFIKSNRIISYSDAKYDLLKFIHFSDAYPIEAQYSVMPVTVIFSVSKTKMKTKSFIINVEVIEKGKFLCNLEIDMKTLLALKNVDEKKEWINLKEKFKNVFAFSLDELTLNNLKEYEKKIVDRLLEAAYKFFQKKKEKDLELINGKEIEIDNQ